MRRRFVKLRARIHEIRCEECRVSWRAWLYRVATGREIGAYECTCAALLREGATPRPCELHGWPTR